MPYLGGAAVPLRRISNGDLLANGRFGFGFLAVLIGDQIAGENLDDVLCRAQYWCDVQADMDHSSHQTFFLYFVACQAYRENCPDYGNRLDYSLDQAPAASPQHPAFQSRCHKRSILVGDDAKVPALQARTHIRA